MSHVQPLTYESVKSLKPALEQAEKMLGFVPNDLLIMAHMPQLPIALMLLANCIFGGDLKDAMENFSKVTPDLDDPSQSLPPQLIPLVAYAASLSAGCMYCQAHTSKQVNDIGIPEEKLSQILNYEESGAYSPAERAAIALAFAAARLPNEATPAHFDSLRAHFSERQIVHIVAVIALFGFLNRWNDTLATALEASPLEFASKALDSVNWRPGKHVDP